VLFPFVIMGLLWLGQQPGHDHEFRLAVGWESVDRQGWASAAGRQG
jgi:hypothetical protein